NLDQLHHARLAGLEANRGARRDVEAPTIRFGAIEQKIWIGLDEVIVAADLNRPIGEIGDAELDTLAPFVDRDGAGSDFARARLPGFAGTSSASFASLTGLGRGPLGRERQLKLRRQRQK